MGREPRMTVSHLCPLPILDCSWYWTGSPCTFDNPVVLISYGSLPKSIVLSIVWNLHRAVCWNTAPAPPLQVPGTTAYARLVRQSLEASVTAVFCSAYAGGILPCPELGLLGSLYAIISVLPGMKGWEWASHTGLQWDLSSVITLCWPIVNVVWWDTTNYMKTLKGRRFYLGGKNSLQISLVKLSHFAMLLH